MDIDLNLDRIFWNKVYALSIPEQNAHLETLLVMFGDLPNIPDIPDVDLNPPPPPGEAGKKNDDQRRFNDTLYQTLTLAVEARKNNLSGYTTLIPAKMLASNLAVDDTPILLQNVFSQRLAPIPYRGAIDSSTATLNIIMTDNVFYDNYLGDEELSTEEAKQALWDTNQSIDVAIFAGGDNGSQSSNTVTVYDARLGRWGEGQPLSVARGSLAATTVGNQAIFAGGQSDKSFRDAVDIYDASTGKWSTTHLSVARGYLAATTVDNLAIFAGGDVGNYIPSDAVDIYDASTGKWSTTH